METLTKESQEPKTLKEINSYEIESDSVRVIVTMKNKESKFLITEGVEGKVKIPIHGGVMDLVVKDLEEIVRFIALHLIDIDSYNIICNKLTRDNFKIF